MLRSFLVVALLLVAGAVQAQRLLLLSRPGRNLVFTRGEDLSFKVKEDRKKYEAVIERIDSLTVTLLVAGQPPFDIPVSEFSTIYVDKNRRTVRLLRGMAGTLPVAGVFYCGMDAFNSSRRGEKAITRETLVVSSGLVGLGALAWIASRPGKVHLGQKGWTVKTLPSEGLERALQNRQ